MPLKVKKIAEYADNSEYQEYQEYSCKNVWTILLEESLAEGADMSEGLKQYIHLSQSLKIEVY